MMFVSSFLFKRKKNSALLFFSDCSLTFPFSAATNFFFSSNHFFCNLFLFKSTDVFRFKRAEEFFPSEKCQGLLSGLQTPMLLFPAETAKVFFRPQLPKFLFFTQIAKGFFLAKVFNFDHCCHVDQRCHILSIAICRKFSFAKSSSTNLLYHLVSQLLFIYFIHYFSFLAFIEAPFSFVVMNFEKIVFIDCVKIPLMLKISLCSKYESKLDDIAPSVQISDYDWK